MLLKHLKKYHLDRRRAGGTGGISDSRLAKRNKPDTCYVLLVRGLLGAS